MRVFAVLLVLLLGVPSLAAAPILSPAPILCSPPCEESGGRQWEKGLSSATESVLVAGIDASRDCGSYVAATRKPPSLEIPSTAFVARYDCDGDPLWQRDIELPGLADITLSGAVAVTEVPPASAQLGDTIPRVFKLPSLDGEAVYVLGTMAAADGVRRHSFLLKLDEEGAPLCANLVEPANQDIWLNGITEAPGGGVLVTGWNPDIMGQNHVYRFDSTCAQRWRLSDARLDSPRDISAAKVGAQVHIYVTTSFRLVRLSCNGDCLTLAGIAWVNELDGFVPEVALALPEGGVYVGGYDSTYRPSILPIGATNVASAPIHVDAAMGTVYGLARRLDGGLHIAGAIEGPSSKAALLVAWDASHVELWRDAIDSPPTWFSDLGEAVATATNGDALFAAKTYRWPDPAAQSQILQLRYCP